MEKQECLEATVCREIGARTGGEILIGVVGPVRTGKSKNANVNTVFFNIKCCFAGSLHRTEQHVNHRIPMRYRF